MDEIEKVILNGTSLQLADTTARTIATDAKQAVDGIKTGFNTQFLQISTDGNYIAPYYCKRNNEVFVEFPNISFLKNVQANVWTTVFVIPQGFRPMLTFYRSVIVGGTTTMLIEINPNGTFKVFPSANYNTSFSVFGGFSFLTTN